MPPLPLSLGLSSARGRYGIDNAVTVENAYSEIMQNGGKAQAVLYPAPGLKPWVTDTPGATRGMLPTEWGLYRAAGRSLSLVAPSGARSTIGDIPGSGPTRFARNAFADPIIPIVSDGAITILRSGKLTPFSTDDMAPPIDVGFIRGRFVYPIADGRFYYSRIGEATVEADAFYNTEGNPDGNVGVWIRRNEIWLFGSKSLEIWAPTEDATDPFTILGGGARPFGCMSRGSICEVDDNLMWVDNQGSVRMAQGYEPADIGTPFTNRIIMADPQRKSIEGHTYQIEGANYYEISGSNFTLRYSLLTRQWTERKTRGMKRWRGAGAADFADEIIVPDLATGNLYKMDKDFAYDGDEPIIMRLVTPIIHAFPTPLSVYSLHVDMLTGRGVPGLDPPIATLRISDDGGETWSAALDEPLGMQGKNARVIWRALGSYERQGAAFEITLPSPVARCVMSALVNAEDGTS